MTGHQLKQKAAMMLQHPLRHLLADQLSALALRSSYWRSSWSCWVLPTLPHTE